MFQNIDEVPRHVPSKGCSEILEQTRLITQLRLEMTCGNFLDRVPTTNNQHRQRQQRTLLLRGVWRDLMSQHDLTDFIEMVAIAKSVRDNGWIRNFNYQPLH